MSFVVSARKYRPARFEDVVGQEHVSQTLKKALQTDHLAHAFLFTGPRGVGKTTCARILARVINCQNPGADFEPCGECGSCLASSENASFNIFELDAASNNSVENIRALVEQVRFQPQQGRYKVFIIDEVHMLSQAAFNAFLKTLEEPPPHAVFILATTEKHKIIPTILSRCQIFDFKRIQPADIVKHLQGICRQEGIEADADALHVVALKADGALRDALSIFDRIVASAGKKITYADVIANLNVLDYDYFFRFADALLVEDLAQVLNIFDEVQRGGFEGDHFLTGLAEHFRNLLVCKNEATLRLLEVGESVRERYRRQAAVAPPSFLLTAINLCNDCDINYRQARHKRLHVEICLIKMCFIAQAVQLSAGAGVVALSKGLPSEEKKSPDASAPKESFATAPPLNPQSPPPPAEIAPAPAEVQNPPLPLPSQAAEKPEPAPPTAATASEYSSQSQQPPPSVVEEPPAPLPEKTPAPRSLGKALGGGIAKLSNLDALDAEVEETETNGNLHKKEARLTQDDLQAAWDAYAAALDRESVKSVLKNTTVKMEGEKVVASVGTSLAENALRQESRLMDFLRKQLHAPKLSLEIKIDASKAPASTAPPKPLTDSEKYWRMKSANPLVDELRKRLDLTLDGE